MRDSGLTLESKLSALSSRTSDAPSAVTRPAKTKAKATGMKDGRRIVGRRRKRSKKDHRFLSFGLYKSGYVSPNPVL